MKLRCSWAYSSSPSCHRSRGTHSTLHIHTHTQPDGQSLSQSLCHTHTVWQLHTHTRTCYDTGEQGLFTVSGAQSRCQQAPSCAGRQENGALCLCGGQWWGTGLSKGLLPVATLLHASAGRHGTIEHAEQAEGLGGWGLTCNGLREVQGGRCLSCSSVRPHSMQVASPHKCS